MLQDVMRFATDTNHSAQIVVALSTLFSLLSLLTAKWPAVSKTFGTFAVADLGRLLRLALKALELFGQWREARKAINGLVVLGVVASVVGCAGTFDEARIAGVNGRKSSPPVAVSPPDRCQSLSERQYWFTGTSVLSGAIGASAAGITLPVKNDTVDTALIITSATAGVVAAGTGWFGAQAGADYVRECAQ